MVRTSFQSLLRKLSHRLLMVLLTFQSKKLHWVLKSQNQLFQLKKVQLTLTKLEIKPIFHWTLFQKSTSQFSKTNQLKLLQKRYQQQISKLMINYTSHLLLEFTKLLLLMELNIFQFKLIKMQLAKMLLFQILKER
jgi:hypothetical protein